MWVFNQYFLQVQQSDSRVSKEQPTTFQANNKIWDEGKKNNLGKILYTTMNLKISQHLKTTLMRWMVILTSEVFESMQ